MSDGPITEGLTFDDVLLVPGKSSVLPVEVETQTHFTRKLKINVPLVSAAIAVPHSFALPPNSVE